MGHVMRCGSQMVNRRNLVDWHDAKGQINTKVSKTKNARFKKRKAKSRGGKK